jgi:HSP20 family protein
MTSLREAMNQLLQSSFVSPSLLGGTTSVVAPQVDMSETENEYIVQASLPGIKPEDVKISVHNNVLSIEGERKEEQERKEGERVLFRELSYGPFSRAFSLPAPVDADGARAEFQHGMLKLTIPKAEAAKPKQIKIQAK